MAFPGGNAIIHVWVKRPRGATRALNEEIIVQSAIDTQMISLSFRAYTLRLAKAGCDQITRRPFGPAMVLVGTRMFARSISWYPFGVNLAMIRSPSSLKRMKRS